MKSFIDTRQLGTLYFDEVYFTYEEPQLFLCKNIVGQLFFGVLSDVEPVHIWYLLPISSAVLSEIKSHRVDLYSVFKTAELGYLWKVISDTDTIDLYEVNPSEIPDDDLPTKGSYLNLLEDNHVNNNLVSQAISERRDIFEMAVEKGDSHAKEISCENLGTILSDTQQLVYALALDKNQIMGPIPRTVREQCSLQVVDTFAASFGIRMKSDDLANFSMETPVTETLSQLLQLLKIKDNETDLTAFFSNKSHRAIIKYRNLLKSLSVADSGIKVEYAAPNQHYSSIHYTKDEIKRNLSVLNKEVKKIAEEITFDGRIIGIEVKENKATFKFITNTDEFVKGSISDSLAKTVFEVPHSANIKVERSIGVDPFTSAEIYVYKLLSYDLYD